jgi:hypothetical protein
VCTLITIFGVKKNSVIMGPIQKALRSEAVGKQNKGVTEVLNIREKVPNNFNITLK